MFHKLLRPKLSQQNNPGEYATPLKKKKNWSQTYIFESPFAFIVPVDEEIQKAEALSQFENQATFSSLTIVIWSFHQIKSSIFQIAPL